MKEASTKNPDFFRSTDIQDAYADRQSPTELPKVKHIQALALSLIFECSPLTILNALYYPVMAQSSVTVCYLPLKNSFEI
jgi:hypothetical protein